MSGAEFDQMISAAESRTAAVDEHLAKVGLDRSCAEAFRIITTQLILMPNI
jgi:hypothetical protein